VSVRHTAAVLSIAGILGPVWFIVLVVVQSILQPDYNHIAMPVSALAAWPAGWMQRINFYGLAAFMASFAIGVNAAISRTRFGRAGIALLLLSCLGLFIAGYFPWIMMNGIPTETKPHAVGAILSFCGASTGFIALSQRMGADPQWQRIAPYVLATGIAMLCLFVVLGAFAIRVGTPLHPWAGLLQRFVVLIWFTCTSTIALKARRVRSEVKVAAPSD
jgi:hypothetical membrane protein